VSLTSWADIFLILPASANIFGKAANGIADDLLSSAISAADCSIIFYPSMSKHMWEKPAMKSNATTLLPDGYYLKYKVETSLEVATGEAVESIVPDLLSIGRDIYQILGGS
jgi:phosphopantothenoylcysteine decarboxylase/phosphopantothenate--cysteine ligase